MEVCALLLLSCSGSSDSVTVQSVDPDRETEDAAHVMVTVPVLASAGRAPRRIARQTTMTKASSARAGDIDREAVIADTRGFIKLDHATHAQWDSTRMQASERSAPGRAELTARSSWRSGVDDGTEVTRATCQSPPDKIAPGSGCDCRTCEYVLRLSGRLVARSGIVPALKWIPPSACDDDTSRTAHRDNRHHTTASTTEALCRCLPMCVRAGASTGASVSEKSCLGASVRVCFLLLVGLLPMNSFGTSSSCRRRLLRAAAACPWRRSSRCDAE